MSSYDFHAIERRWQAHWAEHRTFATPNPGDAGFDPNRPKFYVLDMFPYPSGVGLHVGHPLGYIATDIVGRYKRMRGYSVLHPMGYDAFGLPAEQYAIETGVHPRVTTEKNIANMTRQLKRLGLGYDWDRCVATTDPAYYRWTQWVFLRLYHSYFDPVAGAARPIDELVAKLQGEDYYIGLDGELILSGDTENLEPMAGTMIGVRKWHELEPDQQRALIDEYRLAYLAEVPVNWCPALGTVLANEEVTAEGRSERGNHPVYKRPLRQWMLRITAYADRLADELEQVDWPEPIKLMQRNWIGRSRGAVVDFTVADPAGGSGDAGDTLTVFTTRPDTLFGATYMVLAPEHPLVDRITTAEQLKAVNAYQAQARGKSDLDRQAEAREKTGVFTGAHAINPASGHRIPIWIADYVMMGYGTGAIMAVPAHDTRDHAFATKFGLPIVQVIEPAGGRRIDVQAEAYTGDGVAVNSSNDEVSLDGLEVGRAKEVITQWLASKQLGRPRTQYKLRDWLFSRQRYWGEPFPILHGADADNAGEIRTVPEDQLPVVLPEMDDFRPDPDPDPEAPPRPPLSRAPDDWQVVELDGKKYIRELNTMPQWAGSCWYYLRYLDPGNDRELVAPEAERYWMRPDKRGDSPEAGGVDLYVGGAEHAVLHLLYARFWHKVLYDLGHVSTPEPFGRLFNQGYIQAHAYTDRRGVYVPAEEVEERDGGFFFGGEPVRREFGKMGKSLKNAVAPDDMAEQYGTDTLRLYEMYLGPLDQSKLWNTRDIVGVHRFLQRLWRNLVDEAGDAKVADQPPDRDLARLAHQAVKRVTDAMEAMHFNVAIAALIELNNELVALERVPRWVAESLVRCLAPLAPHIAEELWSKLGHEPSVADAAWPAFDPAMLVANQVELPVQVNGKLRGKVVVAPDTDAASIEAAARQAAQEQEKVVQAVTGKTIRKVIVVPGKLVNLVVG